MIKKQIILMVCTLGLVTCGIFWVGQAKSAQPKMNAQTPNQTLSSEQATAIPDHIFYGEVFSLLANLKNISDYQKQAGLTDDEASILAGIAQDCQREIAEQDAKAQVVILAYREKLKKLDLKALDPKNVPPLPAELTQLQEGRDAIVLHHRDRLRQLLREDGFNRFSSAARNIVKITLTPVQ